MEPSHPDDAQLRRLFELMLLIRAFEPEAERQYKAAKIGGYCHLATGQEAAHVGAVGAMRDDDVLITAYRDHSLALARGVSPKAVMAELFGRVDGCAHGRGGSMHLLDVGRNFFGGWGIVGGHLPVATGLALELTRRGERRAVLCELGDGAVNTGAWHESLNLAALWDLPIVFLVVNNVYGMGTHGAGALQARRGAPHARGARRRRRPARRPRRDRAAARGRAGRPQPVGARGDDVPLPRPLGRGRGAELPQQGGDRGAPPA
jgi:pyruvate dehydrogenase E1 component alpha subunit